MLVQEQEQTSVVHRVNLRERKRPPDEPRQTLTQDVVEALDVIRLSVALARRSMLFLRQHLLVGVPVLRQDAARSP